jgi:hypothetical protein
MIGLLKQSTNPSRTSTLTSSDCSRSPPGLGQGSEALRCGPGQLRCVLSARFHIAAALRAVLPETPFHAGSPRQWVACSWRDDTMRKHRSGRGMKASIRSPGPGVRSTERTADQGRSGRDSAPVGSQGLNRPHPPDRLLAERSLWRLVSCSPRWRPGRADRTTHRTTFRQRGAAPLQPTHTHGTVNEAELHRLMAPDAADERLTLEDFLRRPDWHGDAVCRGVGPSEVRPCVEGPTLAPSGAVEGLSAARSASRRRWPMSRWWALGRDNERGAAGDPAGESGAISASGNPTGWSSALSVRSGLPCCRPRIPHGKLNVGFRSQ